jgi:hypothetical protein
MEELEDRIEKLETEIKSKITWWELIIAFIVGVLVYKYL